MAAPYLTASFDQSMDHDGDDHEPHPRARHAALQTRSVLGHRSACNSPCGHAAQHSFVCPTAVSLAPAVHTFGPAVTSSTTSAQSAQALAHVWHEPPMFADTQEPDMAEAADVRPCSPRVRWGDAPDSVAPWAAPRFDPQRGGVRGAAAASPERTSVRPTSAPVSQSVWPRHGGDVQAPSAIQALEAQLARNPVTPGASVLGQAHPQSAAQTSASPAAARPASMFGATSMGAATAHASVSSTHTAPPGSSATADCNSMDRGDGAEQSRVLAQPAHCPLCLSRAVWHIKQFTLEQVLYVGAISRVLRAVDRATGMTVALKVYRRHKLSDMEKYQVAREIRMHSELYHTNIISLYCAWKDPQYIYVAVEWAPNGDLFSVLKSWGASGVAESVVVTTIFRPLLSALAFIHARGLIHRDLKPENILLSDDYQIKLSDFGLSINQHYEVANTRLGTLNYIPPEILKCPYKHHPLENKDGSVGGYDNKVDVWSLGVLAFELLTGKLPFCGGVMLETLQKIMLNRVEFPGGVSPLARSFISDCLQSDPRARPPVEQLMRHAWIVADYAAV